MCFCFIHCSSGSSASGSPADLYSGSSVHGFVQIEFVAFAAILSSRMLAAAVDDGKRRAIAQLLSLRGVNTTTVGHILRTLGYDDCHRWYISQVLSEHVSRVRSRIQLPLTSGLDFAWPVALPQNSLPYIISECKGFRDMFTEALSRRGCSWEQPWRLVLYVDEITPGNALRPDNKRKNTAVYISWLELGDFLRLEEAWLTVGIIRSDVVKNVAGGFSRTIACLLRAIFLGPNSLSAAGSLLPSGALFFSKLHRILCDEAAGKAVFGREGASGIKPCIDCKNVIKIAEGEESLVAYDDEGYLVDTGCSDDTKFDPMSDADIYRAYDSLGVLKERGISKAMLENAQRAAGFTFDPDTLLSDLDLRPIAKPSCYARDPMHTMLAGGVVNSETFALLRALSQDNPLFSYAFLTDFCSADWKWPKARGSAKVSDIFSPGREAAGSKDQMFKAGASEMLSVYPLIRYFLEVCVPADAVTKEKTSFVECCHVVDLMQGVKQHGGLHLLPDLKARIRSFFRSHVDAYADELVRPKHHYMWHMTKQVDEDGFWLDCFVHERKHQLTKDCYNHIKNTSDFEASVLSTVLNATIERLHTISPNELLQPDAVSAEMSNAFGMPCRVSNQVRFNFVYIVVGDLLFCGMNACLVDACVCYGGNFALLVRSLTLVERPTRTTSRWTPTYVTEMMVLNPGLVRHAACWHERADGTIVALGC